MIKKNLFYIFPALFLMSCVSSNFENVSKGEFSQNIKDDKEVVWVMQQNFHRYMADESPKKFLVKTAVPVRTVLEVTDPRFRTRIGDVYTTKYYASYNQDSFLYGFIEAYHYCKIDNPSNFKAICIPHKIGDFDVNVIEKEYLKMVVSDDYFEIVNKNFGGYEKSSTRIRLGIYNQCYIETLEVKPGILFNHFFHQGCKTSIRPKLIIPVEDAPERLI